MKGRSGSQDNGFLPPASEEYTTSRFAFYVLLLIAIGFTFRSLVHMLLWDGGAGSIAGLDIDVPGGGNIVAMFGQWGSTQLILAIFCWLALLRYRFLIPFALAMIALEQVFRIGIAAIKPFDFEAPPPGAIMPWVVLPLSLIALAASLRGKGRATSR